MWVFTLKIILAAVIIAFSSWLAGKKPELAGFIVALPLVSLIALVLTHLEHKDAAASITFAKSIMLGVPASWLFFLPFFFADRFNFGFWGSYVIGCLLLVVGYFLHRWVLTLI